MKLTVQIMAHPARTDMALDLADRLGLDAHEHITWDQTGDPWDTGARAWRTAGARKADWSAVIQDDALPCHDLIPGLEHALQHVPDQMIVSPFLGRNQPRGYTPRIHDIATQASDSGSSWIMTTPLMWAVAVAVPTTTLRQMIAWGEHQRSPSYHTRLQSFYTRMRHRTLYTWPSLVDHRGEQSLLTHLSPHHTPGRTALGFIGSDASALDLTWDGPTVRAEP